MFTATFQLPGRTKTLVLPDSAHVRPVLYRLREIHGEAYMLTRGSAPKTLLNHIRGVLNAWMYRPLGVHQD